MEKTNIVVAHAPHAAHVRCARPTCASQKTAWIAQKCLINNFILYQYKWGSPNVNYLIFILGNPLSLSRWQWWTGSCSGSRISHAGRHRRGTLVKLSLTHRLGPSRPQPIPSLKPKPNQRPHRADLRATVTGTLAADATQWESKFSISKVQYFEKPSTDNEADRHCQGSNPQLASISNSQTRTFIGLKKAFFSWFAIQP